MIHRSARCAVVVALVAGAAGCSFTIGGNRAEEPAAPAVASQPEPTPNLGPLSVIEKGMKKGEVVKILGLPTLRTPLGDVMMPSQFMPEMWSYRGLGRIYFSGVSPTVMEEPRVERVEYDPSEPATPPPPPGAYGTDD